MRTFRVRISLWLACGCFALVALVASGPIADMDSSLFQLEQAAKQGNNHAMLLVAQRYASLERASEALLWAQRALDTGNKEALTQLLQWYPQNERQWYNKAAKQNDINAQVFIWSQQGAQHQLTRLSPRQVQLLDSESRERLAQLLIQQGSPVNLPHWRALAPATSYWQQLIIGDEVLRRVQTGCDFTFSFTTERTQATPAVLKWLNNLDRFLSQRGYRMCATHRQLEAERRCEVDRGRAFCTGVQEPQYAVSIMVAEKGSANTRNGVVYINEKANWRILLHELGHALGLADEYPMQRDLAQRFCTGNYRFTARNLVLVEPKAFSRNDIAALTETLPWKQQLSTPIAQPIPVGGAVYYRLGSSEPDRVGLYTTGTCEATRMQAWKPVSRVTFMEQHEVKHVP
ncbi:MAG TPA: hypothetical protein VKY35_07100, partial [Aliidiomarina sp.]|nr:hypothetical protein [Aliidiomarina sp.]